MSNTSWPAIRFADSATASNELGRQIGDLLRDAIATRGVASLVVSGGKSPLPFFEALRRQSLHWQRVCITLADERWVDPTESSSNEKLVREHLLQEAAAGARFNALKNAAATPDTGAAASWASLHDVPRPFDAVVLGMGDDGHTASLFPGSPNLAAAVDPSAAPNCIGMCSPIAPIARLSLNLAALLDSRRIFLLLNGEAKWQVYLAASECGPVQDMPVRAVLRQRRTPLDVIWSP